VFIIPDSSQDPSDIFHGSVLLDQALQQIGNAGAQVREKAYETTRFCQVKRLGQFIQCSRILAPGIMEQRLQGQSIDPEWRFPEDIGRLSAVGGRRPH
jgi:hypothetical protein